MRIAGEPIEEYAFVLHIAFAIIAGLLLICQVVFIQKMKIMPVYLVIILSICMCYENCILATGAQLQPDSAAVEIMYAVHALEVPLLILCLYETVYCLYEEKGASLSLVHVEEASPETFTLAIVCLWLIRFVAVCLLVLNLLINYQLIPNQDYKAAGSGGYIYLAKYPHSLPIWLSLIPVIVLSLVSLATAYSVARYGNEYTIGVSHLWKWKLLIPAALAQVIGEIFGVHVYSVTSNAGQLALLIGTTVFLYLAQDDLILTAHFADYLHQSNEAFKHAEERDPETWSHHHEKVPASHSSQASHASQDGGARRGSKRSHQHGEGKSDSKDSHVSSAAEVEMAKV